MKFDERDISALDKFGAFMAEKGTFSLTLKDSADLNMIMINHNKLRAKIEAQIAEQDEAEKCEPIKAKLK